MPVATGDRHEVNWFAHALQAKLEADARELRTDYDLYRHKRKADPDEKPTRPVTPKCPSASQPEVKLRTSTGRVGFFDREAVFCFVTLAALAGVCMAARILAGSAAVEATIPADPGGLAATAATSVMNRMDKVARTTGSWPVKDTESLYQYARKAGRRLGMRAGRVEMSRLPQYGLAEDVEDARLVDVAELSELLEEMSKRGYPTDVINLRIQGYSNDEIADRLYMSERTIRNHLYESRKRLLEGQVPSSLEPDSSRRIRNEFFYGQPGASFTPKRPSRRVELAMYPLALAA